MNSNDAAAANNLQNSVVDTTAHRSAVDMKQLSHFLNGQHPLWNQGAIAHVRTS